MIKRPWAIRQGLSYEQIRGRLGLTTTKQVNHAINRARKVRAVEYEDKREYTDDDIRGYIDAMIGLQEKQERINTKQTMANIRINDNKPIAVAYRGDWHIGELGVTTSCLKMTSVKYATRKGLYFIGGGGTTRKTSSRASPRRAV